MYLIHHLEEKKMKTTKIIVSLILVIAMLSTAVLSFAGCKKKESTATVAEKAFNKTLSAYAPFENNFVYDEKGAYKSTVTIDGSKISVLSSEYGGADMLNGAFAEMALVLTGTVNASDLLANILLTSGGEEVINGDLFFKDNKFVVDCDALLGEKAVGVDLSTFSEKLKDSPLAELLEITEEDIAEIKNVISSTADSADANYITEKLAEIYKNATKDNLTITKSNEKITVDGTEIKANVIKMDLTSENLIAIIKKAVEEIKADEKLCTIINTAAATLVATSSDADVIAELEKALEEVYAEIEEFGLVATARCCISKGYLVLADLAVTADGKTANASLSFGADPSKANKIELSVTFDKQTAVVAWVVDENTADNYKAHLEISVPMDLSMSSVTLKPMSFEYSKKNGNFALSIEIPSSFSASVKGVFKTDKTSVLFSLSEVVAKVPGEYSLNLITYTVKLGVEIKIEKLSKADITLPEYSDILEMNEEAISDLMEKIYAFAEQFGLAGQPEPDYDYAY